MNSSTRRRLLAAFGVATVAVMLSSVAYACTVYRGQMNASGNGSDNVAHTVIGDGVAMNLCPDPGPATVPHTAGNWSVSTANPATMTMITGMATCATTGLTTKLTESSLVRVGLIKNFMPQGGGSGPTHNCHGTTGQQIGTGKVDVNGVFTVLTGGVVGSNTIAYSDTGKAGYHNVCILDTLTIDAIAINYWSF